MAEAPSGDDPRTSWVGWLYRAVVRELGLPTAAVTPSHLESCRRLLRDHLVADQRAYHERVAARYRRIYHVVHRRTGWLFFWAAVVATLHLPWLHRPSLAIVAALGAADPEFWLAALLTALSVFLPARAAALHGWSGHADFFGAALRSAQIETRLEELERAVDSVGTDGSIALGGLALDAARTMESELLAWHAVSRSKPLQQA
jgi:hypothetical protein